MNKNDLIMYKVCLCVCARNQSGKVFVNAIDFHEFVVGSLAMYIPDHIDRYWLNYRSDFRRFV